MKTKLLLTRAAVAKAASSDKPYRLWDTKVPGLFLRVQPSGSKTWNVQWSRATSKSIGKHPIQTLDGARSKALAILSDAAANGTPAAAKSEAAIVTFEDFMSQRYRPWVEVERKAGKQTCANIKAQFERFYKKPMTDITAWSVEKFKSERLKAGIKPATVNRDLDRLRAALSKAVEWGVLDTNPVAGVKRSKGGDSTRVRFLDKAEDKRLRKALADRDGKAAKDRVSGNEWRAARHRKLLDPIAVYADHLTPLVLIALNTGLRRGELFGLKWVDVDLANKQITVRAETAKSGKTRHVPLNAQAIDVLRAWKKQGSSDGLVFPGVGGGKLTNINKAWAGLIEDAALIDFRFHDCRHDFASKLAMAGVDLFTIKELLGHSDFSMTQRYAHLSSAHRASAVDKLVRR
jgi:integrase